jgi:hypothetical protein
MHIGQNEDRRIRQFSLERLCVFIKQGQYSLVVINVTSERSSDGTTIILIETYHYIAQSQHTNAGRLPYI